MNGSHLHFDWSELLTCGQRLLLLGACVLVVILDRTAAGTTLQQLFDGGSIDVGNSQLSDWELISLDSTEAVNPDLSKIAIAPLASDLSNPGLQIDPNNQLSISGVNSIDMVFQFRVHALASGNAFTNHSLALPGIRFSGSGGLAFVSDEVTNSARDDLGPALVIADEESRFTQALDTLEFAPQSSVVVVTDVFIRGLSSADEISLTSFTQSFSQSGPAILPGDYNQDGVVDTGDYVVWRDHLGDPAGSLANDVDGGVIGQAQYDTWLAKFGNRAASVSAALDHAAVPEAASWLLLALAAAGSSLPWRRRSRDRDGV
jgi:hypothetical protein